MTMGHNMWMLRIQWPILPLALGQLAALAWAARPLPPESQRPARFPGHAVYVLLSLLWPFAPWVVGLSREHDVELIYRGMKWWWLPVTVWTLFMVHQWRRDPGTQSRWGAILFVVLSAALHLFLSAALIFGIAMSGI